MKICLSGPLNTEVESIARLLQMNGNTVLLTDSSSSEELHSVSEEVDYLILFHTTSVNRRIIQAFHDKSRIIEVSPVKAQLTQFSGQIVSIGLPDQLHLKYKENSDNSVILVNDISREDSESILKGIFRDAIIIKKSAAEYDRMMSELLVKPYVMSLLARKITDLDYDPASEQYDLVLNLSKSVTNYNIEIIRDTIRNNPHSGEIFASLEENLKRVWNELSFY